MNGKKYAIAVVGNFVSMMVLGWLLHGMLLASTYRSMEGSLMRAEADFMAHFHWLALGTLIFSLAFVWIYSKGVEEKSAVGQGARLGLAVWAVSSLPAAFITFATQNLPSSVLAKSTCADLVMLVVSGIIAAVLYGTSAAARSRTATA